jgi:hypothetical protein
LPRASRLSCKRRFAIIQGVREQEEAFACLHLVIVASRRLELFDADLLIGNVPFQLADVLLGLDKLEIFRTVLHFSSPPIVPSRNDADQLELITILSRLVTSID